MGKGKKSARQKNVRTFTFALFAILVLATILGVIFGLKRTNLRQYASEPVGEYIEKTIEINGETRNYLLRLPSRYKKRQGPYPVVFFLHGGGQKYTSVDFLTRNTLPPLADRDNVILVYPSGMKNKWNDGNVAKGRSTADDVDFLSKLSQHIISSHRGNPEKIYFVGASNGGEMVARMICVRSEKIAAAAMVIASIPSEVYKNCQPTKEVSVMMVNGVNDPIMPYGGGLVKLTEQIFTGASIVPVETAYEFWGKAINATPNTARIENLSNKAPLDGTTVQRLSVSGKNGNEAVLLRVEGGGHTWPSGTQYLPPQLIGRVTRDIDTNIVWDFLMQHQ